MINHYASLVGRFWLLGRGRPEQGSSFHIIGSSLLVTKGDTRWRGWGRLPFQLCELDAQHVYILLLTQDRSLQLDVRQNIHSKQVKVINDDGGRGRPGTNVQFHECLVNTSGQPGALRDGGINHAAPSHCTRHHLAMREGLMRHARSSSHGKCGIDTLASITNHGNVTGGGEELSKPLSLLGQSLP